MFCTKCGEEMADDAESCTACGTQVLRVRAVPSIGWKPGPGAVAPEPFEESLTNDAGAQTVIRHSPVYAGFWLRAVAYAIDSFLIVLLAAPLLIVLSPLTGDRWEQFNALPPERKFNLLDPAVLPVMATMLPILLLCGWLFYALCESSSWQATPGKKWLGLRVSDLQGRPISFARASGRFFGKIITGLMPFGIGYLLAGFTARKQAVHDMIARCLVLRRS